MQGKCFLNTCFAPRPIPTYTGQLLKMSTVKKYGDSKLNAQCSVNIYEDPKLNAQCLVILKKLQLTPAGTLKQPLQRKPRVFKVYSDSEIEDTSDARVKKKHYKRRIKGTKRLFQLSDSEKEIDSDNEKMDLHLNNLCNGSPLKKPAISEFVVEKSISTPEGKRLLKSTISSTNNQTEEINSLTQFKMCQIEEITLSSDEEDSNASDLALLTVTPPTTAAKVKSPRGLPHKPNGTEDDEPIVSVSMTTQDATETEAQKESFQETDSAEEKLEALLASNRFRPTGKTTKPTSPRAISRQTTSPKFRNKGNKAMSKREIFKQQLGLGSYCTSVQNALKKNSSTTAPIAAPVRVYAAESERQGHLPTPKPPVPPVPLPTSVKAKTTSISRGDKLAADLIVGEKLPKNQKKGLSNMPYRSRKIPTRQPSSNELLENQSTPITAEKVPKSDDEFVTVDLNDSTTDRPSICPRLKRISRIPSSESTGASGSSQHLPANSRNRNDDHDERPTATTKANLALKAGISELKRSLGEGTKRVRADGKGKHYVTERRFKIKTFRHHP